jgi:hypothetical protein
VVLTYSRPSATARPAGFPLSFAFQTEALVDIFNASTPPASDPPPAEIRSSPATISAPPPYCAFIDQLFFRPLADPLADVHV